MIRVATSGGFDPLHIGHIRLFKEAKKLGDKLIVILNTDDFLLRKKGFVFMSQDERKEVIEGIKWVDEVVLSIDRDQTVCKTLEMLKPDIFAKGGEWTPVNLPEKEVCDRLGIKIVYGLVGNVQSSTKLALEVVEKINKLDRKRWLKLKQLLHRGQEL